MRLNIDLPLSKKNIAARCSILELLKLRGIVANNVICSNFGWRQSEKKELLRCELWALLPTCVLKQIQKAVPP